MFCVLQLQQLLACSEEEFFLSVVAFEQDDGLLAGPHLRWCDAISCVLLPCHCTGPAPCSSLHVLTCSQ